MDKFPRATPAGKMTILLSRTNVDKAYERKMICVLAQVNIHTSYETAHFPVLRGRCKRFKFPKYNGLLGDMLWMSLKILSTLIKVSSSHFIIYAAVTFRTYNEM